MTEFELIDKLASVKVEAVAPFEIATTHEQWGEIRKKLTPSATHFETPPTPEQWAELQSRSRENFLSVFEKTATKITFPKCDLTNNDLCRAVEELTRGFDKKECRQLLDTLTAHKARLSEVCKEYKKTWSKPAPIEFVCDLLESKLTAQQSIDPRLTTDEAKAYFNKAIEFGLMDKDYNWLKGLQMLSCFAWEMSKALKMGKGDRTAWRPFEVLFGVKKGKLRLNYNDIQKTGQNPSESYLIDQIFRKDEAN